MTGIGETSTLQIDKLCYSAISINVLVLVILGDPWAISRVGRKHELKNFVVPFLPTRLTALGSPRMCICVCAELQDSSISRLLPHYKFLAVHLLDNKGIKEILTQRHQYYANNSSVIPI